AAVGGDRAGGRAAGAAPAGPFLGEPRLSRPARPGPPAGTAPDGVLPLARGRRGTRRSVQRRAGAAAVPHGGGIPSGTGAGVAASAGAAGSGNEPPAGAAARLRSASAPGRPHGGAGRRLAGVRTDAGAVERRRDVRRTPGAVLHLPGAARPFRAGRRRAAAGGKSLSRRPRR